MTAGNPTPGAQAFLERAPTRGCRQPLVLDLGCGNGVFLSALAVREPAWRVVGVEKKHYRVRQAMQRACGLSNVEVLHAGVEDFLEDLPRGSVAKAFLLFSDPWPKRRHAVRRLVQRGFVELLSARIDRAGEFFFATDACSYAAQARALFSEGGWIVRDWVVSDDWPRTEFESRFEAVGAPVWRFRAVLP